MPRFDIPSDRPAMYPLALARKRYPFQNVYCSQDEESLYVNMEAVPALHRELRAFRHLVLLVDCSAAMAQAYERTIVEGEFGLRPSAIERSIRGIVEALARDTDRGIELIFVSHKVVYQTRVMDVEDVTQHVSAALESDGALGGTHAVKAFRHVWTEVQRTSRPATVLFLSSGSIDANARWGDTLRRYYQRVLHKEAVTRERFYCFAIELGTEASGALDAINHLYPPKNGPEDLFEVDRAFDLEAATSHLVQAGGMSSIGDERQVQATFNGDGLITMVNEVLVTGRSRSVEAPLRRNMSFRVRSRGPFSLRVALDGYDEMLIQIDPDTLDTQVSSPDAPGKPPSLLTRIDPQLMLTKGEKRSLGGAALRPMLLAFHWDAAPCPTDEIDAVALLLSDREKVEAEQDFVFYNQPISPCGGVKLLKEAPPPFKKALRLQLSKLPIEVARVMLVLSLHNQPGQRRTFSAFRNLSVSVVAESNRSVLAHFPIQSVAEETALIAVTLYRRGNEWRIHAAGDGFRGGLKSLFERYGSDSLQILE